MTLLTHDLHVHLYGCLSAQDLWELGKDATKDPARLGYYIQEYEKAFDFKPNPNEYWTSDRGFDLLKEHFEFLKPGSFAQFQAKFNLIIALFPIQPNDATVLKKIMHRHRAEGLRYVEYRSFIPPYFDEQQLAAYFTTLCQATREMVADSCGLFEAQMAFSFPRDPQQSVRLYHALKSWLEQNPQYYSAVAGIDFCHFEEGYPPQLLQDFCNQVVRDNRQHPETALAILYHVGESFEGFSVMSSARWVWQAHAMGADRLGHAIALGIDPQIYLGKTVHEPITERRAHLEWLLDERGWLRDFNHVVDAASVRHELEQINNWGLNEIPVTYNQEVIADCRSLQQALIRDLVKKGAVIESCPTSNFRIARIPSPAAHPLQRFLAAGLKVCIATDDPGIFAIDLAHEERVCREQFKLEEIDIKRLASNAEQFKSHCKRPH